MIAVIGTDPDSRLIETITADPEVTIVKSAPRMLIGEMADSHAEQLKERLKGEAIIELDAPLTPSGP
jgi:hypothetical protein